MANSLINHVSNLGLRGLTILFRFLLVLGLGKYYSTADLGLFGLFNTTVTIVIFFLGFDFYSYAHREILKKDKDNQLEFITGSIAFFAITYLIVFPACLIVFFFNVLPLEYLFWFYIIVFFEHISQELYRLFILFGYQLFANVLLFIRVAVWVIPVIIYWLMKDFTGLDLNIIFWCWSVGSGGSIVIGIVYLKRYYSGIPYNLTINWDWVKKGIPVSAQFLVGTLAYKIIEFSDRYFLNYYLDKKAVGVYTFYYNFANILQTLVYTLAIAQLYPKLTEFFAKNDLVSFNTYKVKFIKQIILISVLSSVVVMAIIVPAIEITGKQEFYDEFLTYVVLIAAVTFLNLSFAPHYVLYSMHRDKIIMISTVACALINIVCNLLLTSRFGLIGSALSTLTSYAFLMIIKFYYAASK